MIGLPAQILTRSGDFGQARLDCLQQGCQRGIGGIGTAGKSRSQLHPLLFASRQRGLQETADSRHRNGSGQIEKPRIDPPDSTRSIAEPRSSFVVLPQSTGRRQPAVTRTVAGRPLRRSRAIHTAHAILPAVRFAPLPIRLMTWRTRDDPTPPPNACPIRSIRKAHRLAWTTAGHSREPRHGCDPDRAHWCCTFADRPAEL